MNHMKISKMQKEHGIYEMQQLINSGAAWNMEGSIGREAMSLLESGACMLPMKMRSGAYGNRIPSRKQIKEGTKGSYSNCRDFWARVEEGLIEII